MVTTTSLPCAASLLACAVVLTMWVRSYGAAEQLAFAATGRDRRSSVCLASADGTLTFSNSVSTTIVRRTETVLTYRRETGLAPALPAEAGSRSGFVSLRGRQGEAADRSWTFAAVPWWSVLLAAASPLIVRAYWPISKPC